MSKARPKPRTAYLETTEFQNIEASCESTHSLLEGWVANTDVPELLLTRISVHICKVFLHGLETGCDASTVVRVRFLQLHQLDSDLLSHCRECMQLHTMYANAESVTTPDMLIDCSFRAVRSARDDQQGSLFSSCCFMCVALSECAMSPAATRKHKDSIFYRSSQAPAQLHDAVPHVANFSLQCSFMR